MAKWEKWRLWQKRYKEAMTTVKKPIKKRKTTEEERAYARVKQILAQQRDTSMLLQRKEFNRAVKDIATTMYGDEFGFTIDAMSALAEAGQDFLLKLFQSANCVAFQANRDTVKLGDFICCYKIDGLQGGLLSGAPADGFAAERRAEMALEDSFPTSLLMADTP